MRSVIHGVKNYLRERFCRLAQSKAFGARIALIFIAGTLVLACGDNRAKADKMLKVAVAKCINGPASLEFEKIVNDEYYYKGKHVMNIFVGSPARELEIAAVVRPKDNVVSFSGALVPGRCDVDVDHGTAEAHAQ